MQSLQEDYGAEATIIISDITDATSTLYVLPRFFVDTRDELVASLARQREYNDAIRRWGDDEEWK